MAPRTSRDAVAIPLHAELGRISAQILSASAQAVQLRLDIATRQFDEEGIELSCLASALAGLAARHGAAQASRVPLKALRLVGASSTFFEAGAGDALLADAVQLNATATRTTWRASVSRAEGANGSQTTLIAESVLSFQTPDQADTTAATPVRRRDTAAVLALDGGGARAVDGATDNVPDQRRRQIFLGACKVISEKGYAATTIRDIAKASDLPIATMYQYVSSKEDILFMITKGCMEELFAYFEKSIATGGSASDKIKDAIDTHVKYVSKNRRYINLVYRETKSLSRKNREMIFGLERDLISLWEKIIVEGVDSGEFRTKDPFLAANFIYFLCNIWALRHWVIGDRTEKDVREMMTLFSLSGLKKGRPA